MPSSRKGTSTSGPSGRRLAWALAAVLAMTVLILTAAKGGQTPSTPADQSGVISTATPSTQMDAAAVPLLKYLTDTGIKDMKPYCRYIVRYTAKSRRLEGSVKYLSIRVRPENFMGPHGREIRVVPKPGISLALIQTDPDVSKADRLAITHKDGSITELTKNPITTVTVCAIESSQVSGDDQGGGLS